MGNTQLVTRRGALLVVGLAGVAALTQSDRSRQRLLAELNPVANRYGKYTAYQLWEEEFVGTVEHGEDAVDLGDAGYQVNHLSAVKFHPSTGEVDDSSWRRVDPDNRRWQWHVHAWEHASGTAELFSHYEYRPDPFPLPGEDISAMRQRLHDHYYPKWSTHYSDDEANYFLGRACARVTERVA